MVNVLDQSSRAPQLIKTHDSGVSGQSTRISPSAENDRTTSDDRDNIQYKVNKNFANGQEWRALVDRGANGGIAGSDTRVIAPSPSDRMIDLSGVDDHTVRNLRIVSAGAHVHTDKGPVILIFHQYALMQDGKTIHSPIQWEHYKATVNDKSPHVTGQAPHILLVEGYRIPIRIRNGLPYINQWRFTDGEWNSLPKLHVTSNEEWDPKALDAEVKEEWYAAQDPHSEYLSESIFDIYGNLKPDEKGERRRIMDRERRRKKSGALDPPSDPEEQTMEEDDEEVIVEPLHRYEMEVHLTNLIRDEIQDSFWVMRDARGREYDRDLNTPQRMCNDATSRPKRTTRNQNPEYGAPRSMDITSKRYDQPVDKNNHLKELTKEATNNDLAIPELALDWKPKDDNDYSKAVTDYNNPAKFVSTEETPEEEKRVIRWLGKERKALPNDINYAKYAMHFPGVSLESIKRTFEATTQYGRKGAFPGFTLKHQMISPNPMLNVMRRNEPVATDTVYAPRGVPSMEGGHTAAQFFIGRKSNYRAILGCGDSDAGFNRALMDHIRMYGAMDVLISDNAKAEVSARTKDILRALCIKDWQSEPHNKNQNFAERGWKDTKEKANLVFDWSNANNDEWLLILEYVCFILNHVAVESLGWRTPTEWLLGRTPDISVFLQFFYREPVYYMKEDVAWGESPQRLGLFVGISQGVGHSMTFKVMTSKKEIIRRANIRTALKPGAFNNMRAQEESPALLPDPTAVKLLTKPPAKRKGGKRLAVQVETVEEESHQTDEVVNPDAQELFPDNASTGTEEGDIPGFKEHFHSRFGEQVDEGGEMPTIYVDSLLGRTFISEPDEDYGQARARVVGVETMGQKTPDGRDQLFKFRCKVGDKEFEKLMTYNRMLEWCDKDLHDGDMYKLIGLCGHRRHPTKKGQWQLLVEWETGEKTWNDFNTTWEGDPVTVALYARKHNMLNVEGWR